MNCYNKIMEKINFKKIIDDINIAILVVDYDGKIFYANPNFCTLFNINCEMIKDKKLSEFIPENNNEITIKDTVYKITKTDDKNYSYFYFNASDNQLEKIYSDFISTVSHELRTPLTSIRGFADTMIMSYDKLEPTQVQKFLTIIKEQSNRLIKLVENLLSISKIQVQQSNFVYKSVNAKSQTEQIIDMVKSQYPTRSFELFCAQNVPNILVDENKFQQIMINLIDNAAKYSYERGAIKVSITNDCKKDNFVNIKVEDHGVGIEPQNLSKIFEKFARIDNHLTRKTQGSGLGLFIVKNLIEKMSGSICVKSSTVLPNSGTTFEVKLPATSYTNQSKKILEDK